jgi:hypothetical protein
METIYFYAPDTRVHELIQPGTWEWPDIFKVRRFCSGNFTSWVLTTYLQLQSTSIPSKLVSQLPERGIVIADRDTLGNQYPYLKDVMLICPKGDREFHPSATIHVVHNPTETDGKNSELWRPQYIPHWPQPGLICRDQSRGSEVTNVAFLGSRSNIAKELTSPAWTEALADLGCQWRPLHSPYQWNDYQDLDVVVAVRQFGSGTFVHKPASKLINCWRAGVPAILAPESAFMALKQSDLDFIEVRSLDQAIQAVRFLKQNPDRYQAMIENGFQRLQAHSEAVILQSWVEFFETFAYPHYERWQARSPLSRRLDFSRRWSALKFSRLKTKLARA